MITCDMTGCYDMAAYTLEYTNKKEKETADICDSCAKFWRGCFLDQDETATVKAYKKETATK